MKTRKELRKDKRQQKKLNNFNFHNKKKVNKRNGSKDKHKKSHPEDEFMSDNEDIDEEIPSDFDDDETGTTNDPNPPSVTNQPLDKFQQHMLREKKEENEYYSEIKKNRVDQLKQANEDEDKTIAKYEKLLKLNKRRKKSESSAPRSTSSKFTDGLEYLLELCTDESIQKMYSAAKEVQSDEDDDNFGEDFSLVLGKQPEIKKKKKQSKNANDTTEEELPAEEILKIKRRSDKLKEVEKKYFGDDEDFFKNFDADSCDGSDSELESGEELDSAMDSESYVDEKPDEIPATSKKSKNAKKVSFQEPSQTNKLSDSEDSEFDIEDDSENEEMDQNPTEDEAMTGDEQESFNESENESEGSEQQNDSDASETEDRPKEWEDIYGRKRDKDGNLIKENTNKYVPPHLRKAMETSVTEIDPKRIEKIQNLKRQLKGQINRLAEANLHRVTIDVENLYSRNARHDVNTTLTEIIVDSLVSNVLSSERLVLEHMILIATLHANIGSEIGAFFLEFVVKKFDKMFNDIDKLLVENKELDNVLFIICHLYTYRLFKHTLIYEILNKLCSKITEKRIECILLVLRSIGFVLRKDDPLVLKEFIIRVQKQANSAAGGDGDETLSSRVMYMLDVLMAVKNNNMSKIPQYDATLVDHFRKLLKQFIRDGKYVTTLAITMDDLLNAEERGKWWLVGSAWTGNEKTEEGVDGTKSTQDHAGDERREKIFALARKQRMNTDDKKNIFYILMTAEDYLDAFEKIISTVKDERSIIAVIIHCCLSEKEYNPYYSVLAQKFCDHNRKFLLAIQFTVWDRIKELQSLSIRQISNLARFLIHLIENGSLPLSVLKVIEFSQIEKTTLRFLRQVVLGLLLSDSEKFHQIFERIRPSAKLNPFKDQLRLFLKVFLMKDEQKINISEDQMAKLKSRMEQAEKFLMVKHF